MNPHLMPQKESDIRGIAGIDEAGRGPMIGPLVVCGVLIDQKDLPRLKALKLRDSKTLSPRRRRDFNTRIREIARKVEIKSVSAAEIDALRTSGYTLNEIEVLAFASIAKELRPQEVFMDAADVNAQRFGEFVKSKSGLESEGTKFISEHKADAKYPIVSAAGILAKVERDSQVEELHQEYGDFGSGYPSDPKSVGFVKGLLLEGIELPKFIRQTWESVKRMREEVQTEQLDLDSF